MPMKILYVATVVKQHIMQFHVPFLQMCKDIGWETAVAARNDYENPADCTIPFCDIYFNIPFERSPLKIGNIRAFRELKNVIENGDYDIVHCHTPVGAMLARLAAGKVRKNGTKVIYTAHGFHFYKGAPLMNWLVYYPVEWLLAHWTDVLITINREDDAFAQKHMHAKQVVYTCGVGVDVEKFSNCAAERNVIRKEIGISEADLLLLSVGELNQNKNHQIVIRALALCENPHIHYAIAGAGEEKKKLEELSRAWGVEKQVHLLGYRTDVAALNKAADIFCFPSRREGLGMAALEAMAAGLPIVAASNRGTADLLMHGENGFLCGSEDAEAFYKAIDLLVKDPKLREKMGQEGIKTAQRFDRSTALLQIKKIYEEV